MARIVDPSFRVMGSSHSPIHGARSKAWPNTFTSRRRVVQGLQGVFGFFGAGGCRFKQAEG